MTEMETPAAPSRLHAVFARLREQLSAEIVGQSALIERLLIALLADGHLLVDRIQNDDELMLWREALQVHLEAQRLSAEGRIEAAESVWRTAISGVAVTAAVPVVAPTRNHMPVVLAVAPTGQSKLCMPLAWAPRFSVSSTWPPGDITSTFTASATPARSNPPCATPSATSSLLPSTTTSRPTSAAPCSACVSVSMFKPAPWPPRAGSAR